MDKGFMEVLFTSVLLVTGPRPAMFGKDPTRTTWRADVRNALGETVNHNTAAQDELFKAYVEWLERKEKHHG